MNIYLIGIILSMMFHLGIGTLAGRKVKTVEDYYVAGRRAPTVLIVGSLVASFLSTGVFLGDTGEVYSGFFMPITMVGIIQVVGYLYGSTLFGRYLRRSDALTIGEYFGKRFCNDNLQRLVGITTIVAVTAYMLSAIQGISTLMTSITGLNYKACVVISWLSFAVFTVWSGSSGVLITDTIMFFMFLAAALIGIPFIVNKAGGWNTAIQALADSASVPGIISAGGNPGYLYPTAGENMTWAVTYGIVWGLVIMVSPWQTSRYLMAKDEKTVLKSSVFSAMAVITITTFLYFAAAFVQKINPDLVPSHCIIWAAMNLMPKLVGVLLLTGILAAGISSASTFLSLIGFSLTNDIIRMKNTDVARSLAISRAGMIVSSLLVLILAYFNPPQIFWIMYFGGTVIAASWSVVAIGSVWSRKLSYRGAFLGMLFGFIGCVALRSYSAIKGITLPLYADPFFVGILLSVIGAVLGTVTSPKTAAEQAEHDKLFVCAEKNTGVRKYGLVFVGFSILFTAFMVVAYVIPYMNA